MNAATFTAAYCSATDRLRELHAAGSGMIGYFCAYTPVEIIHAAGFIPVRIFGSREPSGDAGLLLPGFICPYMRTAMEAGMRGEYDFLSGLVQGYSCDAACGASNIWRDDILKGVFHLLPLPYNDSTASREFLRSALTELTEKLNAAGGAFSETSLASSMELYRRVREAMLRLYARRQHNEPGLSATDFYSIVLAGFSLPPEEFLEMITAAESPQADEGPAQPDGTPVMVSGSVIDNPLIFGAVEKAGGRIAADDLCTGYRAFYPADGRGGDPVGRLIDRCMRRPPCPSRSRASERAPLIAQMARDSGAGGVIFLLQKFCTPHLADYPVLSEELKKSGIPCTVIELEHTGALDAQAVNRIESFIEMLRRPDGQPR